MLILADRFKGKTTNESWKLGHQRRLWQPRGFDHVIRRDESVYEKAEYILNNPVRKGFVAKYDEWPYWRRWDPAL